MHSTHPLGCSPLSVSDVKGFSFEGSDGRSLDEDDPKERRVGRALQRSGLRRAVSPKQRSLWLSLVVTTSFPELAAGDRLFRRIFNSQLSTKPLLEQVFDIFMIFGGGRRQQHQQPAASSNGSLSSTNISTIYVIRSIHAHVL